MVVKKPKTKKPSKTPPKRKLTNVITHSSGIVANEGPHVAVVISTEPRTDVFTKYGVRDMQMFVLRVKQRNADDMEEFAEIHQQYSRTLHPKSSLVKFIAGFGISPGSEFDCDDLVGKKVNIIVTHSKPDVNGKVHANIQVLPPVKEQEPEPKPKAPVGTSAHKCGLCGIKYCTGQCQGGAQ
jgi:hypothetical protein